MTVPVLLTVYKRPQLTRRALAAVAAARPELLMVAADGPRDDEESELCARTREVIDAAALACPVQKNYAQTNMGCGVRMYTAIDWALSDHDAVIVLEDDCIASPSFFRFCRELLRHYRHDERVMHISGNNFQRDPPVNRYGYYFSKYPHAWGWATWRRAWRHFDHGMRRWPELKAGGLIRRWCDDPHERRYWTEKFDRMHLGAPDVWDYQWMFACWSHGGLAATPRVNLVSNVGTGADATHTREAGPFFGLPTGELSTIEHPPDVLPDAAADAFTFEHNFGGRALREAGSLRARVSRMLRAHPLAYRAARGLWRLARRRPG